MIALFSYWMIPAAISALSAILIVVMIVTTPMRAQSNGGDAMAIVAIIIKLALLNIGVWVVYWAIGLGVWLARLIGG